MNQPITPDANTENNDATSPKRGASLSRVLRRSLPVLPNEPPGPEALRHAQGAEARRVPAPGRGL